MTNTTVMPQSSLTPSAQQELRTLAALGAELERSRVLDDEDPSAAWVRERYSTFVANLRDEIAGPVQSVVPLAVVTVGQASANHGTSTVSVAVTVPVATPVAAALPAVPAPIATVDPMPPDDEVDRLFWDDDATHWSSRFTAATKARMLEGAAMAAAALALIVHFG